MFIFHPHDVRIIGPMLIPVFLAGWVFFDRQFAGMLAVMFKAYIFGSIVRHALSPLPLMSQPILDQSKYLILWTFAILEGGQVCALLWLATLKKRVAQDFPGGNA